MGVGEKPKNFDLADYVLGHFPAEERSIMDEAAKTAAEAIRMIITENADAAMNHLTVRKRNGCIVRGKSDAGTDCATERTGGI